MEDNDEHETGNLEDPDTSSFKYSQTVCQPRQPHSTAPLQMKQQINCQANELLSNTRNTENACDDHLQHDATHTTFDAKLNDALNLETIYQFDFQPNPPEQTFVSTHVAESNIFFTIYYNMCNFTLF